MSDLRDAVISILRERAKPMGAYAIAHEVERRTGHRCHTNSVYRCLAKMLDEGLARRVASLSSYVLATSAARTSALALCRRCRAVLPIEAADLHAQLAARALASGFATEAQVIEVLGLCADCAGAAAPRETAG